jgi:hypothetical protein
VARYTDLRYQVALVGPTPIGLARLAERGDSEIIPVRRASSHERQGPLDLSERTGTANGVKTDD